MLLILGLTNCENRLWDSLDFKATGKSKRHDTAFRIEIDEIYNTSNLDYNICKSAEANVASIQLHLCSLIIRWGK